MTDVTTGGQILIAMIGALSVVLVALIQSGRRISRKAANSAAKAVEKSSEAVELARPTGNGYAARTEATLTLLLQATTRLEHQATTRLEHVEQQLRDLGNRVDGYHPTEGNDNDG